MKIFGPFFASSLFALSVDKEILSGNLVYLVIASISCLCYITSMRLKEPNASNYTPLVNEESGTEDEVEAASGR